MDSFKRSRTSAGGLQQCHLPVGFQFGNKILNWSSTQLFHHCKNDKIYIKMIL